MKRIIILTYLLLSTLSAFSQVPLWATAIGSTGDDAANITRVAPNGNVYVAGHYTGTMDLDPSTATTNISSYSGSQDMFLACYSSAGNFQWGFSLGREDYDDILGMAVDGSSNVIVSGFFRGQNVDFDPSTGTALLSANGTLGGAPSSSNYGGDGFVAKYSATGTYQWAFALGSPYWIEVVESIATDASGNIYIGGQMKDIVDFDPSSAVANLNGNVDGTGFLAKYSSSGAYQWAFHFGKPGIGSTDNTISDIKIDGSGNVCVAGFFQGSGPWDFDPSVTGTANLTSNGNYDAFVAKYTSSGAYLFAFNIGSSGGVCQFIGLTLDPSNNIYVTGYTNTNSVDFDPSSSTAISSLSAGTGNNIMLAKYNSSGGYLWGKLIGGTGSDIGRKLIYSNNRIFCTGGFSGTVDFNPGGTPSANLVSSGNDDIYWASYDLSGNYKCSFKIGSSGSDHGYSIIPDASGNFYMAGYFSGANVDFDPGSATLLKTSNGSADAFLAKYQLSSSGNGYFSAATKKCGPVGDAYLTYTDSTIASGASVTITYSDGVNLYTRTVNNKMPFLLTPSPTVTTTYTLSAVSASSCGTSTGGNPMTVQVLPLPVAFAGNDTAICSGTQLKLTASGGKIYQWYPATGISNPTSQTINPVISGNITYNLIAIDSNNCRDTDQVVITAMPSPTANAGTDRSVCENLNVTLAGSGGNTGMWYPATGLSNPNSYTPSLTVTGTIVYNLVVTDNNGCSDTDDVKIMALPSPVANAGADTMGCLGDTMTLTGTGGLTYQWYGSNIPILSPNTATTKTVIAMSGKAFLVVTNAQGCRDTDDVDITLYVPEFKVPGAWQVCEGDTLQLMASGGTAYSWYPATGLSETNIGNPVVKPTADITYHLAVSESFCSTSDTFEVKINVREKPSLDVVKSGDVDCSNGYVTLGATGAAEYVWSPSSTLSSSTVPSPIARPFSTTQYTVIGKNQYGCSDTGRVTVKFEDLGPVALITPDVFSPNGDGKNDCYRVHVKVPYNSFEFAIYDRWGKQAFFTEDPKMCWDGIYSGLPAELGTYFYYLRIKTEACGEVFRKGDIELVR